MAERPILVEVKSAALRPSGEIRHTWWATVDRHPFSDKQGYPDEATARAMAEQWCREHYPTRKIVYEGDEDAVRTA